MEFEDKIIFIERHYGCSEPDNIIGINFLDSDIAEIVKKYLGDEEGWDGWTDMGISVKVTVEKGKICLEPIVV